MGLDRNGTATLPARSWGLPTTRTGLSRRRCSPCSIRRWRRFATARPWSRRDRDPDQHGWNSLANLAWRAVLGGGLSTDDILERLWEPLPADRKWANLDSSITDLWPGGKPANGCSRTAFPESLRARIWRLVFPNGDDVLAAYFLLLQLTGGEPSWAQSLSIDSMQVRGNGCVLTGFKGRQPFATVSERVFPRLAGGRVCVPTLWALIVELTAPVRHVRCARGCWRSAKPVAAPRRRLLPPGDRAMVRVAGVVAAQRPGLAVWL